MSKQPIRKRCRITKTLVEGRSLAPGFYVDEKVDGFLLKVTPAGRKIYLVYGKAKGYKAPDKHGRLVSKPITYTIGEHGKPAVVMGPDGDAKPNGNWTADKAEDEAKRIWGLMRSGINPNEHRRRKAESEQVQRVKAASQRQAKLVTLRKVFEDYLKDRLGRNKLKESTAYVYRCDIEKCLADWLERPIGDISDEEVVDRHKRISKTHPGQANHVMRILRALFNYAADEYKVDQKPIVSSNPVTQLSKKDRWNELGKRDNIIKDHQLKAFFEACGALEHPVASDYLQFLLLTGLRAKEAASLSWAQVDFKGRTIHIIETKNKREHWLPLSDYLYAMLKARAKSKVGDFVFSNGIDGYMSDYRYQIDRVVEKCRELLALDDDDDVAIDATRFGFTPHDLRRSFGTIASLLLPDYIVKRLLNHVNSNDVTQTHYIHASIENLRKPMQDVNNYILNHAGITEYGTPAVAAASKVVRLQPGQKKRGQAK